MKNEQSVFEFHGSSDTMATMLERSALEQSVGRALARSRGVVLSGPRQSGKSTLAQQFLARRSPNYFDLEYPPHLQRLDQPAQVLEGLQGLVVIDEVQLRPGLFPLLRVLMDRSDAPGQFLLLGSASPALLRQSGESLLGRVETVEVAGFDLTEIQSVAMPDADDVATRLWLRGGFPRAYLAASDEDAAVWCSHAVADHVRVDMPQFGVNIAAPAMLRFWSMLAHYHGQVWSAAPVAQSMGVAEPTIRRYLDTLTQTLMVRQLQPWHENVGKRQVKAPKIYFRDTGLLHALLGIKSHAELLTHPLSGASWEGFALEQVLRIAKPAQAYFWATHQGAELDLLMLRGTERVGVEFKRTDAPVVTRSMRTALQDLRLDRLYVVYPGLHRYVMGERVEAVPLWGVLSGEVVG